MWGEGGGWLSVQLTPLLSESLGPTRRSQGRTRSRQDYPADIEVQTGTLFASSPSQQSRPERQTWGQPPPPATWASRAPCRPAPINGVNFLFFFHWGCNLIESVDETLQPSEVPDQLEDPHHSHHSDQPHYLPSLAHDLKILTNHHFFVDKNVSITVPAAPLSQGPTWRELWRKNLLSSSAAWKISTSWENIWIWQGIPSEKITRLHSLKKKVDFSDNVG